MVENMFWELSFMQLRPEIYIGKRPPLFLQANFSRWYLEKLTDDRALGKLTLIMKSWVR